MKLYDFGLLAVLVVFGLGAISGAIAENDKDFIADDFSVIEESA